MVVHGYDDDDNNGTGYYGDINDNSTNDDD